MLLETLILTELEDLCDGRVYPVISEEKVPLPLILITVSASRPEITLQGACGITNSTVDIDIWALTYQEVLPLIDEVKTRLHLLVTENIKGSFLTNRSTNIEEFGYHAVLSFNVWHKD